jgi:hypothetical protein
LRKREDLLVVQWSFHTFFSVIDYQEATRTSGSLFGSVHGGRVG